MTKLSDIQLILLTTAAQRADGSLLPPSDSLGDPGERIQKAVAALLKRGLAAEAETTINNATWREDGDLRIAANITAAGREAIGAVEEGHSEETPAPPLDAAPRPDAGAHVPKSVGKQAMIIDLMTREAGATLKDLEAATGWLPHTTRAALTGLRKKGRTIVKDKVDGATRYTIVAGA